MCEKVTSIDSGLEAFSLYLTDGSLTAMVNQPTVQPNIWINRSSRTESNYYKPTNIKHRKYDNMSVG